MTIISSIGDTVSLSTYPVNLPKPESNHAAITNPATEDTYEPGTESQNLILPGSNGIQFSAYSQTYSPGFNPPTQTPPETAPEGGDDDMIDDIIGTKGG